MSRQYDLTGQQTRDAVQLELELRSLLPAPTGQVLIFPKMKAGSGESCSAEDAALAKVLAYAEKLAL